MSEHKIWLKLTRKAYGVRVVNKLRKGEKTGWLKAKLAWQAESWRVPVKLAA